MTDEKLSAERENVVRHVFADATGILEGAHAIASAGQGPGQSKAGYCRCARRLEVLARDVTTLADALPLLMDPDVEDAQ